MYASTWICTKEVDIDMDGAEVSSRKASLAEMMLEGPAMRME
jgi:betaine lipid synthase